MKSNQDKLSPLQQQATARFGLESGSASRKGTVSLFLLNRCFLLRSLCLKAYVSALNITEKHTRSQPVFLLSCRFRSIKRGSWKEKSAVWSPHFVFASTGRCTELTVSTPCGVRTTTACSVKPSSLPLGSCPGSESGSRPSSVPACGLQSRGGVISRTRELTVALSKVQRPSF